MRPAKAGQSTGGLRPGTRTHTAARAKPANGARLSRS